MKAVQEYTENIDWEQRDYDVLYCPDYDVLELGEHPLEVPGSEKRHPEAQQECKDQGGHHIHHRRDVDGEEWFEVLELGRNFMTGRPPYKFREYGHRGSVGQKSSKDSVAVSYQYGNKQQPSGSFSDVRYRRGHKPDYNQRNQKLQKVAENAVERHEQADCRTGQEESEDYAQYYCDKDPRKESEMEILSQNVICFRVRYKYANF